MRHSRQKRIRGKRIGENGGKGHAPSAHVADQHKKRLPAILKIGKAECPKRRLGIPLTAINSGQKVVDRNEGHAQQVDPQQFRIGLHRFGHFAAVDDPSAPISPAIAMTTPKTNRHIKAVNAPCSPAFIAHAWRLATTTFARARVPYRDSRLNPMIGTLLSRPPWPRSIQSARVRRRRRRCRAAGARR